MANVIDNRMLLITFYYNANIIAIKLMFLLIIDYFYGYFFLISLAAFFLKFLIGEVNILIAQLELRLNVRTPLFDTLGKALSHLKTELIQANITRTMLKI